MGQPQTKSRRSEVDYSDAEDELSPSERRQQRERERDERRKRKAERDEKKVQKLTSKYAPMEPNPRKVDVADIELFSNKIVRTRSESLESAADPPTRLERYFGETGGSEDSRRISWSIVSLMVSVGLWDGFLAFTMVSLQLLVPFSNEPYFYVIFLVLRVVYGLVSDSCPRQRRKVYLLVSGFGGFVVLVVAALVKLDTPAAVLAIFFALWILAGVSDVVTDGIIVERSFGKESVVVWRLQAKRWLFHALGEALVFFAGDWLLDNTSPQIIFGCLALFPGMVMLSAHFLTDSLATTSHCRGLSGFCRECTGIGRAVLKKRPFFSLLLLLTVCLMPSSGGIIEVFLERQRIFPVSLHYLQGASWVVCILVCLFYPTFLQQKSPRSTFFFSSLVSVFVGLLPLFLLANVHGEPGVSNAVVVFASTILLRLFTAIQFLSLRVMCVQLVPQGVEASFYATLTSVLGACMMGGKALGLVVLSAFGTPCVPECDFSNIYGAFLVCQLSPLLPLAVLGMVFLRIRGKDEYVCSCLPWARGVAAASPRTGEKKIYLLSSPSRSRTEGVSPILK